MTPKHLEQLRRFAELQQAATPGPYYIQGSDDQNFSGGRISLCAPYTPVAIISDGNRADPRRMPGCGREDSPFNADGSTKWWTSRFEGLNAGMEMFAAARDLPIAELLAELESLNDFISKAKSWRDVTHQEPLRPPL